MNPIRREVLNGLFVIVLSTLLSAAIATFQLKFNLQVWSLILMGAALALGGYVIFEYVVSAEGRETEWLQRVGTPPRLELESEGGAGMALLIEGVKTMKPGSDLTVMVHYGRDGAYSFSVPDPAREKLYASIMEQLRGGVIREYKRLLCFDHDVLANDPDLGSGILRVGTGPARITMGVAEHCRLMLRTPRCSLYVAPVILRSLVVLYGADKASMSVDTIDRDSGAGRFLGAMLFHDPPNREIIEQLHRIVRETERRMVAVHKIVFPEDEPAVVAATP